MKKVALVGVALLVLLLMIPMVVIVMVMGMSSSAAACQQWADAQPLPGGVGDPTLVEDVEPVGDLTATQTQRAAQVFGVGRRMGIPEDGIVVALAVASQESSFRVLANDGLGGDLAGNQAGIEVSLQLPHDGVGSDHGSLGIMQQQWPTWSSSMEELMDPETSLRLFYAALQRIDGWDSMSLTQAAQAVQNSAHPSAYADDEPLARSLFDHFTAPGTTQVADDSAEADPVVLTLEEQQECAELLGLPAGLTCPPTGSPVEAGLTPDALMVMRCVNQQFGPHTYGGVGERATNPGSDHPSGRAVDVMIDSWEATAGIDEGTAIAEWVRAHAAELGVKYVIWRAQIWNVGDAGWSAYSHPSGATDPVSLHMDHVHVSVYGNRGTGFAPTGTGSVVYPVPASMIDSNQDNWGETGPYWSQWHTGTDFSLACGTPVLASHAGTVTIDPTQATWAGPNLVKISLGPGQVTTWYAHMQTTTVKTGDVVVPGQQIGELGAEGNVSGCHLHFEVHLTGGTDIYGSDNVDPTPWLAQHVGQVLGGGTARVASFNVLGHSHTAPGGERKGWADSATRMKWTVQLLDATAIEIVGFQEFQPAQEKAFWAETSGRWASYPHSRGRANVANVVAWRTDRWQLVRAEQISIPYFGGVNVRMPYVLLRNLATGQQVWVASFHNPADAQGPAEQWRTKATLLEARLARRLASTGTPVVFTGDMNEREDYFCPTLRGSPLRAANGGTVGPDSCSPPPDMEIDWVMGANLSFTGYASDRSIQGHVSDHPLVSASITLPAATPP